MNSCNILVVEDNIAHIRLIEEALKESGSSHQMIEVNDGVEAMAYLRKEKNYADVPRPDIILLDLNLPKKMVVKSWQKSKQTPISNEFPSSF